MKIDELLYEINKYDFLYAQTNSEEFPDDIVISIKDGINRLPLIVFPKDELNPNDCYFYTENLHNNIGPVTLRNVLNMVTEYLSTPIDKRFTEKDSEEQD